MNNRSYSFGTSSVTIEFGDIITSESEVIVSSDDYMLTMGGGVSAAIRRNAGEAILVDTTKSIPAQLGDVIVTTAGALSSKYVFHGVTIGIDKGVDREEETIDMIITKSLSILKKLKLHTISFPALGTGSAKYGLEESALQISESIYKFYCSNSDYQIDAKIYLFDRFNRRSEIDYIKFFEEFSTKVYLFSKDIKITNKNIEHKKIKKQEYTESDIKHKKLIEKGIKLTHEREIIERRLSELQGSMNKNEESKLHSRLTEIQNQKIETISLLQKSTKRGLSVFISYAHEDEEIKIQLSKHLSALEHQGLVTTWHDRKIVAGTEWKSEIDNNLNKADMILLLISSDFIHSRFCYDIEMKEALERHKKNDAIVIPIIVRSVHWSNTPFAKLQVLPTDGKPINEWENKDRAYMEITESIGVIATDILNSKI